MGRLTGRGVQLAEPPEVVSPFDLLPEGKLKLPIAGFGNVTSGDAIKIAAALTAEAVRWGTPTVHFAGATVQEFPTHRSVVLPMEGEAAELLTIARAVTQCVQRRGLRFDRRKFLPLIAVATIGEAATSAQVMTFLHALEGFQGVPWTVDHVSLMRRSFGDEATDSVEYAQVLLGGH